MPDKEFLEWIRDRLRYVHGENINFDYMHKPQCNNRRHAR